MVARNIQRARDHGLPGFCCYYKLYDDENFDCTSDWSKRYNGFSPEDWALLQSIYEKPSDIDLFTGGLAQKPLNGGLLGKVFNRMLGNSIMNRKINHDTIVNNSLENAYFENFHLPKPHLVNTKNIALFQTSHFR